MKKIYLVAVIAAALLSGCYTPEKATQQADKAMNKFPEKVLPLFRGKFPCITTSVVQTTDSAAYKKWQDSVNKIHSFYGELLANVVPDTVHDSTTVVDSARCNDLLVKYRLNDQKHLEKEKILSQQLADLQMKLKTVPPVNNNRTEKVKDSAEVAVLQIKIHDKDVLIDALRNGNEKKGKYITWLLIALLISAGLNILQFKKFL